MRSMRWSALALSLGAAACSPMTVDAVLEVTVSPRSIRTDQMATITVKGVDELGKPGTGSVRIKSTAGVVEDPTTILAPADGTVTSRFTCPATDANCKGSVRITAEWTTPAMKLAEASTSITVTQPVVDAGTDAGMDAGSTSDAGMMDDAGMPVADGGVDAGMGVDASVPDAGGLTLTVDRAQIVSGVGELATITATLRTQTGELAVNENVAFTTSLGTLVGNVDGGTTCQTSDAGSCSSELSASTGMNGVATVSAAGLGYRAQLTLRVLAISQIRFAEVSCTQTTMNCNLMGLQGSGFNETANVRFQVIDPASAPVRGIPVSFSLIGAPTGTSVDPMQTTDSNGYVNATVRSGRTVGTFAVRARAYGLSVDSPTIGVRGAKPSNRGFTLQCNKVNISAFNAPAPPRPISIQCQVGLTDRYNNPVGTGTAVRLSSEAGSVPNNVATTPYSPSSAANEGRATFPFITDQGVFPAGDVTPFAADPAQYPFPRIAEPFWNDGPIVQNPRDGLVSLIAYLQGEEDFRDNDNNGMWDPGEQYIDQGEPLLDSNDNNQWDTGEFYVDTNSNGAYDGPNGMWDATTQIWTEFKVLYTGPTYSPQARVTLTATRVPSSASFGPIAPNTSIRANAFLPDRRLNRVTSSSLAVRLVPSTRGSVTAVTDISLDSYGFRVERRLLNAAGTGDCVSGTTPACTWYYRFGSWDEGLVANLTISGGQPPSVPTAEDCVAETTVDGVTAGSFLPGIVQ